MKKIIINKELCGRLVPILLRAGLWRLHDSYIH